MSYPFNSNSGLSDVDSSTESNPSVGLPHMDASDDVTLNSPHIVIRGESTTHSYLEQTNPDTAHIDWFSFTVRYDMLHTELEKLRQFLHQYFNIPPEMWRSTNSGWQGYDKKILLGKYGHIAYEGSSQRDTINVSIYGQGCSLAKDWNSISEIGIQERWKIKRVDLAYDDFYGVTVNIKLAIKWYEEGLFKAGGRQPKPHMDYDFDTGDGKTFNIGKRENGKFLRIYEKGRQLGDPSSPWCRAEVEFKSKDRVVPWDILYKAGQYLAGSYKAFEFISIKQCKIKTNKKATKIKYEAVKRWVRTAAGRSLNAVIAVEGGDLSEAFSQVVRDGYPSRISDLEDHMPAAAVKES